MKTISPEVGTRKIDAQTMRIEIMDGGPYVVYGNVPISIKEITPDDKGHSWSLTLIDENYSKHPNPTALCRCGNTKTPPYCDGSHAHAAWDATLTASHEPLLDGAEVQEGPTLSLTDNEQYCAFARFCDAKGRTWNQIDRSDEPAQRELAIRTASACPAGRLKVWNNQTNEAIEPKLAPEIALLEDPVIRCSGPIYVTGGIPIVDVKGGYTYQPRNRVTLCRCGNSENKPFCDGTHASSHYRDRILR